MGQALGVPYHYRLGLGALYFYDLCVVHFLPPSGRLCCGRQKSSQCNISTGVVLGALAPKVTYVGDVQQLPPFAYQNSTGRVSYPKNSKSTNRAAHVAHMSILRMCVEGPVPHTTVVEQRCLVEGLATIFRANFVREMWGNAKADLGLMAATPCSLTRMARS